MIITFGSLNIKAEKNTLNNDSEESIVCDPHVDVFGVEATCKYIEDLNIATIENRSSGKFYMFKNVIANPQSIQGLIFIGRCFLTEPKKAIENRSHCRTVMINMDLYGERSF